VPLTDLIEAKPSASGQLRNEPVQARSTARLTALLDAAAAAVHELGYERLTTAMVAERAGASIGTVYRYFPDRIAVLQALAARNLERVLDGVNASFADRSLTDERSALSAIFDLYADAFRTEPGFGSLRAGDVIDLRPAIAATSFNAHIADVMVQLLAARFGTTDTPDIRFAFENAVEVMDALVARAFSRSATGDTRILDSARTLFLTLASDALAA
jgi:AcrR family transcriptional regulator